MIEVIVNLNEPDFEDLLRLRLVVARIGEMDNARWWNTKGMLGRLGGLALERGFPRSHRFAQARVVFAAASQRSRQVFDPPDAITLWALPAHVEEQFESLWGAWTEEHGTWWPFFERLQTVQGDDLLGAMLELDVITERDAEDARKLRRAADNRAVPIPGVRELSKPVLTLLGAGFFRSEQGQLAVPYAKLERQ